MVQILRLKTPTIEFTLTRSHFSIHLFSITYKLIKSVEGISITVTVTKVQIENFHSFITVVQICFIGRSPIFRNFSITVVRLSCVDTMTKSIYPRKKNVSENISSLCHETKWTSTKPVTYSRSF